MQGGWAGAGTNLTGNGSEIDLTSFEGIGLYVKGNGKSISIAIVTGNFSDIPQYNHWQFTIQTTAEWTFHQIPFSYFTIPWGNFLPFDLTRAEVIQFKITETGNFDVEIDDIMFYYGATPTGTLTITLTHTPSFTATMTATKSSTFNIPSSTFTATSTRTATNTATNTQVQTNSLTPIFTATDTPTQTETADSEFKFDKEYKITIYPNPANFDNDIKIRYKIIGNEEQITVRIYTNAFRLVTEISFNKSKISKYINEIREITIKRDFIKSLSKGVYYYIIIGKDNQNNKIKSKINNFLILK